MTAPIYHIAEKANWDSALSSGTYTTESLRDEGFIHCCTREQVPVVLDRYYSGSTDLIILMIDPARLSSPVYYDWSPTAADSFPHLYGSLNTDAVTEILDPSHFVGS